MPDMDMGGYGPLTWHLFLTSWHDNLVWDVLILAALAAYVAGLAGIRRRGVSAVPWYRAAAFVLGLLTVVVSVNTALETYSHVLFWVHMVQHLLLIMVAPALLILGSPLTVLVRALPPASGEQVGRWLVSGPVAAITHPITGFLVYSVVIVATHLTSFMEQMMVHPWLHQFEHVLYLGAGYLFLLPLLGDEPIRWRLPHLVRMLLLFLAMAPDTVVGIVLLQTDHELFPSYAEIHRMWGPSPVADLNCGGGIMWAFGDGLMMLFILGVMVVYLAHAATNATAGSWLEGIRRQTLADHLRRSGDSAELEDGDLDADDHALAAYNAMLQRLNATDDRPSGDGSSSTR